MRIKQAQASTSPPALFFSSLFSPKQHVMIAILLLLLLVSGPLAAQLVINEFDYDQAGTDAAEFVEIKNTSGAPVNLSGWSLVLVNATGPAAYDTINLPALSLAAGDYFVVCANNATVANCDLDDGPDTNFIQNGAPDAVSLFNGGTLVDTVSYEGDTGAPYTEGSGAGLVDDPAVTDFGLSRSPDGTDTNQNNVDFSFCAITPGIANTCSSADEAPSVVSTSPADAATGVTVSSNIAIDFSEDVLVSGAWFGINCSSSGAHTAVVSGGPQSYSLNPDSDFDLSETCTVDILAAGVNDTDTDDPPDNMDADFQFSFDTNPFIAAALVINEVDYDQAGTDAAEFIEIANTGTDPVDLNGYSIVLINGSGGGSAVYDTIALPAVSLAAGDYFVVCGDASNTFGCDLDVTPNTNLVQNGSPDAVALVQGSTVIDTVSYEGNAGAPYTEGSGSGLEDDSTIDFSGISRFPDGVDTNVNNVDFSPRCVTPGAANSTDTSECDDPRPPALRINEIDYDQPGSDTAEFVEIINAGNSPADLTGVELWLVNGSGPAVYNTIVLPSVSLNPFEYFVVCANAANTANCDLDASPDSNFLQNGAPDAVALVLDSVVLDSVSYEGDTGAPYTEGTGAGLADSNDIGQDHKGISRFPNGADTNQNNVDLVYTCITPGFGNTSLTNDCSPIGPVLEIFEIQGNGSASPFAGQGIATLDNIVTAVGTDGFFMQTPDFRADGDVSTSNGIFVFTGGAPTVAVGDQVDVAGSVTEFFDFTEFSSGSSVSVDSGGNPVPVAVVFDDTVPSPDPTAPSCAIEFECYEGMLVQITGGTVTGPNQGFSSDPVAEVHITAAGSRTYREPGIEYPGLFGYPEWDGNPEVFELDPDKLGLPNQIIPAGSSFDAIGAIGYEFGGYELWPTSLNVTPAALPQAVRSREVAEMTVGALNLFRLFDDINDFSGDTVVSSAEYARRLAKFSVFIREVLDAPDILAVSEVESLKVLQDLASEISSNDPTVNYTAYLEEGNDVGGIDVGFLVLDTVLVDNVTQLGLSEILTYDGSLLNDRPPLLLEGRQIANGSNFPIAVMAIHSRSLGGIEDPGSSGERVRQKRLEQAQYVAQQVQLLQDANPDINLVVAGDFNAYEFSDSYVDVTGHMKGSFTAGDNLVCETNACTDHVSPDLIDQVLMLASGERYSFVFQGNAQALDHALTSSGLDELVRDFQFGRGNSDAAVDLINDDSTPLRSSDHDGLVLFLIKDSDGDGVTDDADYCPGTVIPESAPTSSLGINNFALTDNDRIFDTNLPEGVGPQQSFDIFDTAGCSCEQIVVEQGLGKGHIKFGCSLGAMEDWVEFLNLP